MGLKSKGMTTRTDFGKRGVKSAGQVERKPTSVQRLKALGSRLWGKPAAKKKPVPRGTGVRAIGRGGREP